MIKLNIDLATHCSRCPGGRYRKDGKNSGEEFRDDVLIPALETVDEVTVFLGGVVGLNTSFAEEVFGGVVRKLGPDVCKRVHLHSPMKFKDRAIMAKEFMSAERIRIQQDVL